jgi:hypothetical protein
LANWVASLETAKSPLVTFGTSSDRIFSPPGERAYYATFAKSIPGTRLAPYVGLSWSTWEDTLLFPAGVNIALAPEVDLLPMHDGRNTHLLLTFKTGEANFSVMLIKMERLGLSFGAGF